MCIKFFEKIDYILLTCIAVFSLAVHYDNLLAGIWLFFCIGSLYTFFVWLDSK